jgi:hypothetical protein
VGDWIDRLSADELRQWNEIVQHIHDVTVPGMEKSAFVVSLIPEDGKPDVKFAVELGLTIMLGKPLVVVALPGTDIPPKLRQIADLVLELDPRIPAQGALMARELKAFMKKRQEEE